MTKMLSEEIEQLGLDPNVIALHQKRIKSNLGNQKQATLPVKDTCRIDNGGIIPFENLEKLGKVQSHSSRFDRMVAFVPAAGAASRYFKPLVPLVEALEEKNEKKIEDAIQNLKKEGAESWALPECLKETILSPDSRSFALENLQTLLGEIQRPKALQPAVISGESFLYFKSIEHQKIGSFAGQIFVVPDEMSLTFEQEFEQLKTPKRVPTFFMEQGPKLSTIRFRLDGTPYRDEDGQLSPVPAGHGTLIQLIQEIPKLCPEAHTLFIRNIDNVMGTKKDSLYATETFLKAHEWLLSQVSQIRQALRENQLDGIASFGNEILDYYAFTTEPKQETKEFLRHQQESERVLWHVLIEVFHSSPAFLSRVIDEMGDSRKALLRLFERPVNSLGQVPNNGRDMGGTPVFTEALGQPLTMCLEVPHASQEDQKNFLSNPEKATHFNPVFVASEVIKDCSCYEIEDSPFWILAQKNYGSEEVVYHETVLYELLGNSMLANVVFPEIPRSVFHPHKTLSDSRGRRASDWMDF